MAEKNETGPQKVTDIDAAKENIRTAVDAFTARWVSLPALIPPCEVMDVGQLRDAMGLYATFDLGDPWPSAEQELLRRHFSWHQIGNSRVMILREREDTLTDDGWNDGEELMTDEEW